MKKQKLNLTALNVDSFVTDQNNLATQTVKGGVNSVISRHTDHTCISIASQDFVCTTIWYTCD